MSADGAKLSPDGAPAPRTKSPSPLSISPANGSVNSSKQSLDPQSEFSGDLETNNVLPSQETLKKIEDYQILDVEGRTVPFKSIYTGPNVARRVLVIFVRHFFCGVRTPNPLNRNALTKLSRTAKNTSNSSPNP